MTKVSELNQVNVLKDDSLLMAVQDGESVKFQASLLQKANVSAANADAVGGIPAASIATKSPDGTLNADALGGVSAQALLERIRILESKLATRDDDPAWCRPIPWVSTTLPRQDGSWAFCDGRQLARAEYQDLFNVIRYQFTRRTNGGILEGGDFFNIPDLRGRMILGITNEIKTTLNLPHPGDKFHGYTSEIGGTINEMGQWIYPRQIGQFGGDPTCAMVNTCQMPMHDHQTLYNNTFHVAMKSQDMKYEKGGKGNAPTYDDEEPERIRTSIEGDNRTFAIRYPGNEPNTSEGCANGMLSISPYVAFSWVMRIRR